MVDVVDELSEKQLYATVKDYDVYGFENFKYKKDMVARLWKNNSIRGIINTLKNDGRYEELVGVFTNTIVRSRPSKTLPEARKQAESLLNWFSKSNVDTSRYTETDDVFNSMAHLFKDDVEFEDFAEAMTTSKDKSARAKGRIDFDMNIFEEEVSSITMMVDGHLEQLNPSHFAVRDMKTILDRTANSLFASASLAKSGNWKTVKALDREIALVKDVHPEAYSKLRDIRDLVVGIPLKPDDMSMHQLSMIGKDLAVIAKLPLVVLSLGYEAILTFSNGGFMRGLRHSYQYVTSSYGKDSEMYRQMSMGGLGRHVDNIDATGTYHSSINGIEDTTALQGIRKYTKRMRDAVLLSNGLTYASDAIQRINKANNSEQFALFVQGKANLFGDRLKQFGITQKDVDMFQGVFELNESNHLKKINFQKMTKKQIDRYEEIMFHIGQNQSIVDTMGASPLVAYNSALGRVLTSLIGYPLQQFNIHGVESLRYADKTTFMHSIGAFGATYFGLKARAELMGREYSEEELITYSLASIPLASSLNAMTSLSHPAVFDVYGDLLTVVGVDKR